MPLREVLLTKEGISSATRQEFDAVKGCLGERQKIVSRGAYEWYISEDFADLAAFNIEEPFIKPFACEYLKQDANGTYRDRTLANKNPKDPHSSDLLRTLSYYSAKSMELPPSCQAVLKDKQVEDIGTSRCPFFE